MGELLCAVRSAEAAAKAIRDQTDALNELEGKRRETQANLDRISDRRRGGGFTADESRAATTQAERIRAKFDKDALSDAAIEQAVGSAFGRGDFTEADLIALAFRQDRGGLNANPEDRIEIIRSRLDATNRNDPESLTKLRKLARTRRGNVACAAAVIRTTPGSTR